MATINEESPVNNSGLSQGGMPWKQKQAMGFEINLEMTCFKLNLDKLDSDLVTHTTFFEILGVMIFLIVYYM